MSSLQFITFLFQRKEFGHSKDRLYQSKVEHNRINIEHLSAMTSIWSSGCHHLGSTDLNILAIMVLLPAAHSTSFLGSIHTMTSAFLSACATMVLASPTSWDLHGNLGFTFTTSHTGLFALVQSAALDLLMLLFSKKG